MPLNVLKKTKSLAQMRKEEAQKNTVAPETAAMDMPPKARTLDTSGQAVQASKAAMPPLIRDMADVYERSTPSVAFGDSSLKREPKDGWMQLREAIPGKALGTSGAAGDALVQPPPKALKGAGTGTGNPGLEEALRIAASTSHNLDIARERWGMKGINYIGNLIRSGHGAEAALIISLPSHAKAVIVAEENMRTVALNRDAILAQTNAVTQDKQNPYLMKNAAKRAEQQALNTLRLELIDGGALGDHSSFKQGIDAAERMLDQTKTALNRAVQMERAQGDTLTQAQDRFHANLADTNACNAVLAAIDNLQKATAARRKAESAFQSSRQALQDAQEKLSGAQKRAMANVESQARQRMEELRLKLAEERAGLKEQGGTAPDQLLLRNVSIAENEGNPLARPEGSGIIKEDTRGPGFHAAEALPGLGNAPWRALASAGSVTDAEYSNGDFGIPDESLSSSGEGHSGQKRGTVDEEIYWRDIHPEYVGDTAPPPAPTTKPLVPKYTVNLAKKGGYANNQDVYPGANESTLMPLTYLMQAEAQMVREKYPYAADQMISGNEKDKRSECVGMSRLPGVSWYPPARMKNGAYVEDRYPRMFTTVGGLYRNSTHAGDYTADTEKFDGMHLITKGFNHVVVYWKEFFDGEKMHYNVIVHNTGRKYIEIDEKMSSEEIAAAENYNRKVDAYNKDKKAEIIPLDEAIKKYKLEFAYWCAPDYIDYGDQRNPDTGDLLTPKKQWK